MCCCQHKNLKEETNPSRSTDLLILQSGTLTFCLFGVVFITHMCIICNYHSSATPCCTQNRTGRCWQTPGARSKTEAELLCNTHATSGITWSGCSALVQKAEAQFHWSCFSSIQSSRSHKESNFHQEHNVFYYNVRGGVIFGVTCPLNTNPNLECMSKERHWGKKDE